MAAAIRIKLSDLLSIISDWPQEAPKIRKKRSQPIASAPIEMDLEAIRGYLLASGRATKQDVSMELHMSSNATVRRLNLLKERGVIVDLPGHNYGLKEAAQ